MLGHHRCQSRWQRGSHCDRGLAGHQPGAFGAADHRLQLQRMVMRHGGYPGDHIKTMVELKGLADANAYPFNPFINPAFGACMVRAMV